MITNSGVQHEPPAIKGTIPKKYPWLSEDRHCDVCVVGGGLTGAMCALEASLMDLSTVLITSGAIGYGETGHLSGGAEYDCGSTLTETDRRIDPDEALRLYSMGFEALDDLQNLCGSLDAEHGNAGLSSGFRRRDSMIITPDSSFTDLMEREYSARRTKFHRCTFITPKNASSSFDFRICGGILTKEGGAVLDPYSLAHLCLVRAESHGAEIYEQTSAIDIQTPRNESGCVIIRTSSFRTIYADKLIMATGKNGIDSVIRHTAKSIIFTALYRTDSDNPLWPGKCLMRTFGKQPVSLVIRPDGHIAASAPAKSVGCGIVNRLADRFDTSPVSGRLRKTVGNTLTDCEIKTVCEYSREATVPPDGLPVIGTHESFKNCIFALSAASSLFGDTGIPVFSRIAAKTASKLLCSDIPQNDPLFDPMRKGI